MNSIEFEVLRSVGQLRRVAPAWDELWQRSQSSNPTARAEPLAEYLDHFAPGAPLGIVIVRDRDEFLAALPLLASPARMVPIGRLPGNVWTPAGTLLIDPRCGTSALDALIAGLKSLAWPLLAFDAALPANPMWQTFRAALERAGMPPILRTRFQIDRIDLEGDWDSYVASRSTNHRKQLRKMLNRSQVEMQLRVLDHPAAGEVAPWLRRAFVLEDSGWKGRERSSVLSSPGVFDFFVRQAEYLAAAGTLRLVFLEHQGQPIAMEYGWIGKGTYFSLKVAYDETFARLKPGRLLRALLIQHLFSEGQIRHIDLLGPSSRTTHDFATSQYPLSRMLVPVTPLGRALLGGHQLLRPVLGWLRGGRAESEEASHPVEPVADDSSSPAPELASV